MKYKEPQATIEKDGIAAAYLEYAFSQISAGVELQSRFNIRSEELKRKEQRDFNNRRLGMEDAGMCFALQVYLERLLNLTVRIPPSQDQEEVAPVLCLDAIDF
jgi:hypothetical protein